jgi:hypothetical protein
VADGGSYVIDPETGEPRLVERTRPAPAPWEVQPPTVAAEARAPADAPRPPEQPAEPLEGV